MKNNLWSFLAGCVLGSLVTFMLHGATIYFHSTEELGGGSMASYSSPGGVNFKTLGTPRSEFDLISYVFGNLKTLLSGSSPLEVIMGDNFLLTAVVTSYSQLNATLNVGSRTWGRVSGWMVVVGTKGINNSEKDMYNLFSARQCEDFSSDRMTALELICLLSAIGSSDLVTQYKWFVIAPNSTYISTKKLTELLLPLDYKKSHYIGQMANRGKQESYCKGETGIVLSRGALTNILPHLGRDKNLVSEEIPGDVWLGQCFSQKLQVTCSASLKVQFRHRKMLCFNVYLLCVYGHEGTCTSIYIKDTCIMYTYIQPTP